MMTRSLSRPARLLMLALLGVSPLLGGCVGQGAYDGLFETNRSLKEQNEQLRRQRDEATAAADQLRAQLTRSESALAQLRSQNGDLRAQLDRALADLAGFGAQLGNLQLQALDPETDRLLKELASQFPDLLTYDPALGMLRFASDLTFDSGSADVRSNARASIDALARVLNTPAASGYDVIIVGHTDSQRISSRTASRHPTNVHLSAHRSIAVRDELVKMGVQAGKVQVAGWGEFRPLVPNSPTGNTPQNRRVEIFLTRPRNTADAGGGAVAVPPSSPSSFDAGADRTAPPQRQPEIVK
jgi:chemotaxis protein MotB